MPSVESFEQLLRDLREGLPAAATTVYHRYATRLIALARQNLSGRLRRRVDPEDVLQSVFRSFFGRTAAGEFDLQSEHGLWRLLVRLTLNKCGCRARFEQAACRDVRRDQAVGPGPLDEGRFSAAGGPSPVEAAMLAEVVAYVLGRLATEPKRRIFEMSLQGHSIADISTALGYYERGVERVRAEIQQLLEGLLAAETGQDCFPQRRAA